ncbi:MAG: hypothetical protein ACKO58_05135 [Cyanobium sp.]
MTIEVTVAIIGATAALVGAMVGAGVSVFTTRAQLASACRQIEADQLRRVENSLEALLREWTSMKVDVTGPVNNDLILSRFTDMFLARVQLFMTAAHHFPPYLEEELQALSEEVNRYIYATKTGNSIDSVSEKKAFHRMQTLDIEVPRLIRKRLRCIQAELSSLLHKHHANKRLHADARGRAGEP